MAYPSTLNWEYRTTGNNLNAGMFDPSLGGTDYSQQDAAQVAYTDLVIGATNTQLTSATTPFTAAMVGNGIAVASGTGFTVQRAYILSVAAGVATMDRAMGTANSTGGVGKLGGALALMTDALLELVVAGNMVWIKAGTYTLSGSTTIAADGTAALPVDIIGYNATRGDNPTGASRPILAGASLSISFNGNYWNFNHIRFSSYSSTGACAVSFARIVNCYAENTSGSVRSAFVTNANYPATYIDCEGVSAAGSAFYHTTAGYVTSLLWCYAHDSPYGFNANGNNSNTLFSVFDTCTYGLYINSAIHTALNNTFYSAVAGSGIYAPTTMGQQSYIANNIFNMTHASGVGVNYVDAVIRSISGGYNNFYACGTDRTNFPALTGDNDIDPQFVDAPNGDFTTGSNVADTGRGITLGVG